MHSKPSPIPDRRTHSAQFKAAVMAACRVPGASVAAVARANGVNDNLVHKWLGGQGLKRCGLQAPGAAGVQLPAVAPVAPALQFVPVQLPAPAAPQAHSTCSCGETIQIELTRAGASLTVRWPAAHASACIGWLGELAAVLTR